LEIQEQLKIRAERSHIFTYMNDITNRPAYIPMLEKVILLEEGPIQVGSRYVEVATIAGRELKTTYQVMELQTPEKIRVQTIKSVFPIEAVLLFEEQGAGTLLTMQLHITLKGIYQLGAPVVRGIVQQQAKDILGRLKGIFEDSL
jgi:carbon monoxide dehydrogenase subunit G